MTVLWSGVTTKLITRGSIFSASAASWSRSTAGRFAGGSPATGYRYNPVTRKIVPDPEMVPLVRRVFESDLSAWHLARALTREGISLPYPTIERIRSNPTCLGLRPNSGGVLVPADWPAIIDKDLWDRQQGRRNRASRRSPREVGPSYLLTGIIRCHNCGGAVVGSPIPASKATGMPLFVYRCLAPHRCAAKGGQLSGWLVDLLVLDALKTYAGDPEALKDRYARAIDAAGDGDAIGRRAELQVKARELQDRQARLIDAVEQGLLPDHVVKKRQKAIAAESKLVNDQLGALVDATLIPSLPDLRAILALARALPEADRAGQRALLERLATFVEIDPRRRTLVVTWRLGGEARYRVPVFRGGPCRKVEVFMERVAQEPGRYLVPADAATAS